MPGQGWLFYTALSVAGSEVEDKPEAPGEAPDPGVAGLSGARPLGMGVAVLPPLPPDMPFLPSAVAKKRPPTLPTVPPPPPPPPPRLDQEVIDGMVTHFSFSFSPILLDCLPRRIRFKLQYKVCEDVFSKAGLTV